MVYYGSAQYMPVSCKPYPFAACRIVISIICGSGMGTHPFLKSDRNAYLERI